MSETRKIAAIRSLTRNMRVLQRADPHVDAAAFGPMNGATECTRSDRVQDSYSADRSDLAPARLAAFVEAVAGNKALDVSRESCNRRKK
jgi:hypothetical protein